VSIDLIFVSASQKDEISAEVEQHLLDALAQSNTQSRNEHIVLKANDSQGDLVAGLTAATSYSWLLIKTLWVADSQRGTGLGRKLVVAAEEKGLELGCSNAWLDTSNPAAHGFYLKLGYRDFGVLQNDTRTFPPDHQRWFMRKKLFPEPPLTG